MLKPGRKSLKPLARLTPFLARYKPQIIKALIALAIASGSTLIVPIAVRRIIDHGFTASNANLVNQYFGVMIAVVLLLAVSSAIRFYYVMWLGEKIVADVRDTLFEHLLKLSPGFYETQKTGEVVSRLTADTTQIKSAFSSTASIALRNGVMLVGAIAMMIVTSPKLAGLAGLAIPLDCPAACDLRAPGAAVVAHRTGQTRGFRCLRPGASFRHYHGAIQCAGRPYE